MAVLRCLGQLLSTEEPLKLDNLQRRQAQLPLARRGMGLRSAERGRSAAYSASWADTQRHLVGNLAVFARCGRTACAAAEAADALRADGFQPPAWDELLRHAADEAGFFADLDAASRALLLSDAGDHVGGFFTVLPTPEQRPRPSLPELWPFAAFTCLFPSVRVGSCRGALDALGDHCAACARAGVLGPRSVPLERTAARICREAGARVAENVLLRDLSACAGRQPPGSCGQRPAQMGRREGCCGYQPLSTRVQGPTTSPA